MGFLFSWLGARNWARVHREQLVSLARATPAAMIGYAANVLLAIFAFSGVIPQPQLGIWAVFALSVCAFIGLRSVRKRNRTEVPSEGSSIRSAGSALAFGVLLALPWTILAAGWAGELQNRSEIVLIALSVGMAASGSVLLSPIPAAAVIYVATILVPLILKSFFLLRGDYLVIGALAVSYLAFLLGLIATNARLFMERLHAVNKLKEMVTALSVAREETERAAMTDGLTGLANRRAFIVKLNSLVPKIATTSAYTIFFLDLDGFKPVNDTLGHAVGDSLLKAAAGRIANSVRSRDLVARLGGDEFAIIAQNISDRTMASALAERLTLSLTGPFNIDGQRIQIGVSVGVAISSESTAEPSELLKQADIAMYAAKAEGGAGFCIFEPNMQRAAEERRFIETGLQSAIANREFELYFQPIRHLATEALAGFECHIRWVHPERGVLPPVQFLKIADDIGMADEIADWVIMEACSQAARWPGDLAVGINLSPLQIASGCIVEKVERVLEMTGLAASRLELEITETSLLSNDVETIDSLRRLKHLGVSIALDDFGTGYSSLSYLVSFPFTRIKIDRLFISQLGRSKQSDLIVRSIAQLAKSLNCSVVAEGIETAEQLRRLRALNVSHGQGFFLGKPMTAVDASKLITHASAIKTALAQTA